MFFFFNDTATTEIYTLSLHDALPICKNRDQPELFVTGSLRQLVPDDHILARVDHVLDLSWLRAEVADLYCPDNGRPGIDPGSGCAPDAGRVPARPRVRPTSPARGSGQPRHPLVHRLRPARDAAGPFLADPHP